ERFNPLVRDREIVVTVLPRERLPIGWLAAHASIPAGLGKKILPGQVIAGVLRGGAQQLTEKLFQVLFGAVGIARELRLEQTQGPRAHVPNLRKEGLACARPLPGVFQEQAAAMLVQGRRWASPQSVQVG